MSGAYQGSYERDEVCPEGHPKLGGAPCEQCEEESKIPVVLQNPRAAPAPVFAACHPGGAKNGT